MLETIVTITGLIIMSITPHIVLHVVDNNRYNNYLSRKEEE